MIPRERGSFLHSRFFVANVSSPRNMSSFCSIRTLGAARNGKRIAFHYPYQEPTPHESPSSFCQYTIHAIAIPPKRIPGRITPQANPYPLRENPRNPLISPWPAELPLLHASSLTSLTSPGGFLATYLFGWHPPAAACPLRTRAGGRTSPRSLG